MRQSRTILSSLVMLLLVGALATCAILWSRASRPSKSPFGTLVFLGYSNSSAGVQLANFAITNTTDEAAALAPHALLWFEGKRGEWTPQTIMPLSGSPRRKILGPSMSEVIAIPSPPNLSPWRISVYLSNDVGPALPFKQLVNWVYTMGGKPPAYGWATSQIDSGRITNL